MSHKEDFELDGQEKSDQSAFSELVKKAYEKGLKEQELTVGKLIEDIKAELKNLTVS